LVLVWLRARIDGTAIQIFASPDAQRGRPRGTFDLTKLSDEYGTGMRFSGPMAAICCQDLNRRQRAADLDSFIITHH
jgi:xylan 1,4-beta-xylosidase